jgi:hypothetical protein
MTCCHHHRGRPDPDGSGVRWGLFLSLATAVLFYGTIAACICDWVAS